VYDTGQISIRVTDLEQTAALVDGLIDDPPGHLGGLALARVEDLSHPVDVLPPTPGVRVWLTGAGQEERARVIVRPSGTEPKLKCYREVAVPPSPDRPLDGERAEARQRKDALHTDLTSYLSRPPFT